jgi:hypothetical protein
LKHSREARDVQERITKDHRPKRAAAKRMRDSGKKYGTVGATVPVNDEGLPQQV